MDGEHRGVDRQVLRGNASLCTQPPGLEQAGAEVLPEAPPRLFTEFIQGASKQASKQDKFEKKTI